MITTKRESPVGSLLGNFDEMHEAGCLQAEVEGNRAAFIWLKTQLKGNICDGCPVWDEKGQDCKAYRQYHMEWRMLHQDKRRQLEEATKPSNGKYPGMNMKQIAKHLGISLNQTRKMKREGTL